MLTPLLATVVIASADPPVPPLPPLELTSAARLDYEFAAGMAPLDLGTPLPETRAFDPDDVIEAIDPVARFGERHSWRWTIQLGYADDLDDTDFLLAGAGLSWFAADDLSLNFELNTLVVSQPVDDSVGINLSMIIRWHFLTRESWSLFGDAGIGLMYATEDIPPDGSQFNFTPQLGLGGSFAVSKNVRVLLGARWYHISNGRIFGDNPGVDTIELWAGLSVGF